jgi:hypothetical protein
VIVVHHVGLSGRRVAVDPVHGLLLVWDLPTPGGSMRLNIVFAMLALFGGST